MDQAEETKRAVDRGREAGLLDRAGIGTATQAQTTDECAKVPYPVRERMLSEIADAERFYLRKLAALQSMHDLVVSSGWREIETADKILRLFGDNLHASHFRY